MAQSTESLLHLRAPARLDTAPPLAPEGPAAFATSRREIELSLHESLGPAEAEWRAFEASADCTPFQTFDWLAAWDRHVGEPGGTRPAIVIGRRAGETLFIMPLAVTPGRLARRLTFLGQDLCDYNAPLLAFDFAKAGIDFPALWREVRELIQSHAALRHDIVELTKMPDVVGAQANPFLALDTRLNPSGAYQTTFGGAWEQFYTGKRSSATRRRDRTKLKRLGEMGAVTFVTPDTVEATARTLDTLIGQKAKSFARMGVPNMFARPGTTAFFREVAARRALVHISRLDVGSVQAAINLGLTHRDCYYHILASYDDGEVSRFGPGAAHLRELLQYAIKHGLARFDFTIGDEPYKRDWCDTEQKLHDHVSAASLRGLPPTLASAAWRRVKRTIKKTDVLWSAAQRVRVMIGGAAKKPAEKSEAADGNPVVIQGERSETRDP